MEILMYFLRFCLLSCVLVAASSSGLDLLSPSSSSPPPPLPVTSKGVGEVPISSPESHKPGNAPPPKASLPSSPPIADLKAPPPKDSSGSKPPAGEPIVSVPSAPGPVSSPVSDIRPFPSVALPQPTPSIVPPRNASNNHKPPIEKHVAPVASPPTISPPVIPKLPHSSSPVPTSSPTRNSPTTLPAFPIESPPSDKSPVAAPSNETAKPLPILPHQDSPTSIASSSPKFNRHSHRTSSSPPLNHLHHQDRKKIKDNPPPPPPNKSNRKGPISFSMHPISIAPSPSPTQAFPLRSSSKPRKLPPLQALPPPPPNSDCSSTVCLDPYTNTPPGSPCGCVWPIQVELRLTMPLYDFFPMVSEFAREISAGVFMKQSQVRIMGANAATEQPDKTILLIDLVPLGDKFDNMTAMLTYQRFYRKKVYIDATTFGQYEVVYVRYPGLPVSPPSGGMTVIDHEPFSRNNNNNGMVKKPFGVDVPKKMRKREINGGSIAVIVLSAAAFIGLCFAVVWFLAFRRGRARRRLSTRASLPSLTKPPGSVRSLTGSRFSSTSLSFESSIAPLTLSAKTFSASEIAKATSNFAESRVLGEGGFGKVYEGLFDDGTKVAVKVLKRDDQQGGREFLAEVEMLSRLHHRNLVNLIGICIEDRNRSLVYELIPNGSVESHLHGVDKESSPLDWEARLKIALGAARGLAYLHEDSNPRVIHRDFKSSNILLEQDFTPKVSDFGLARNALDDEDNRHISTRVMGTFGYVAPEYAMTGHLLVKSDVYSYGVVLLELLTGRKPVDMSQPPGQENLVSWTRSFLTSREGLEAIIDQSLGQPEIPFDSVAKVAAIASMCVQPEVSHRPFMGEVVQALKLVCNECDEAKELNSVTSLTHDDLGDDNGAESSCGGEGSRRMVRYPLLPSYDSEPCTERGLSVSEMFTGSGRLERVSNSGPLASGGGKRFWQKMRRLSTGSLSEHGSSSLMVRSGSR